MYNLQGLIRKDIINATTQFERLGYVSSNLTNMSTTGYKPVRFETMVDEDGYLTGSVRTNHATGAMRVTENPFDIGIAGMGFIPVTSATGEVVYTRDGSFKVNKDGYMETTDGYLVGDGIKVPVNYYALKIKENGDVQVVSESGGKPEKIGQIPIVQFQNPEGLKQTDGNKLIATADSGEPILLKEHNYIQQGYLESSGTNVFGSVNEVLRLNASMLASLKLLKVVDDMYNKAINLRE